MNIPRHIEQQADDWNEQINEMIDGWGESRDKQPKRRVFGGGGKQGAARAQAAGLPKLRSLRT